MIASPCHRLSSIFLMATLFLATPVCAQTTTDNGAQPVSQPINPASDSPGSCWKTEGFERQEFREEMEQIRREHEELVTDRSVSQEKCAHATDAIVAECADQKQALQERQDRLHERVSALRERITLARKEDGTTLWQTRNQQPAAVTAASDVPASVK